MTHRSSNPTLRDHADGILRACLEAVEPEQAVKRFLRLEGNTLVVGSEVHLSLDGFDRIVVVGGGKAGAPMGKAVEDLLGDRVTEGLICVKYDHGLPLKRIRIAEGAHPVPDESGERAAREITALLRSAGEKDLVISCISGGGSALLPLPAPPVSLAKKQALIRDLLAVGANIHEMNAVRKHLSLTKGGNLMREAYPATVVNLMLSDVVGDDQDTIASGPFVPDPSTFDRVWEILQRYGLGDSVAEEIRQRILSGVNGEIEETPKPGDKVFERAHNVIVGSNILALKAGKKKAVELGYDTLILSSTIEGDTGEAARFHAAVAREIHSTGNPTSPPACILSGGETTVTLKGDGLGGRNQEFALHLVEAAAELPNTLFVSAGTDGTDGPTDAAGAITDDATLERGRAIGLNPAEFLAINDSYHYFEPLGDLIMTGPTRTNVMDVRIILVSP